MKRKDKIKGGLSDGVSIETIAKKHRVSVKQIKSQLKIGREIEMEHVDDYELAEEIALDHLFEIPDYYTRLEKMEKKAEKDMKKENITEFAKRMRELTGLSENNNKKTIKTIQEGESTFEGGIKFMAEDMNKKFKSYKDKDGNIIYDLSTEEVFKYGPTSIEHFIELAKEDNEIYEFLNSELKSNEGVDVGNELFWGADIIDALKKINEDSNKQKEEEFEIYEFEQKSIEENENDKELYNLNENTIIVLDFLNEEYSLGIEPELNVVGEIKIEDIEGNIPNDAEYAKLNPSEKFIEKIYKFKDGNMMFHGEQGGWHYSSYNDLDSKDYARLKDAKFLKIVN